METFQVDLTPAAAQRLREAAARSRTDPGHLAAKMLDELLIARPAEFDLSEGEIDLIQSEVDAVRAERSKRSA